MSRTTTQPDSAGLPVARNFNFDFEVSFTEDQQADGAEYDFLWEDDPGDEGHGLSSFALEDGMGQCRST